MKKNRDKYPNNIQYRSATGYGCPDTAACDTKYYGFKNQVRNAAALFHQVLSGGWSNYHVGNNQIAYHPNGACGSSTVYIENLATAALYRYTPYQPNSAALNWGSDACSSYGNRNFYHYFTEWFGSTQQDVPVTKYQTIADGEYVIASGLTYDTVLTADGNNNSSNVTMRTRANGQKSQRWRTQYHADDHSYTFTNVASGKVLDLYNAATNNGTNIQIYDSNGSCAQRWNVIANSDGSKTLLSACSKAYAIDVNGGNNQSGANVQLYGSNNTAAQNWFMIPDAAITDGVYEIIAGTNESLRLDAHGGLINLSNGTNIQVYVGNNTAAQKWQLKYNAQDGTYTITNPYRGLSLDVSGGNTSNGTNIQMYTQNGTSSQKWYILPQDGGYVMISQKSGRVMDINNGGSNSGANVQLYVSNRTKAQTWKFTAANIDQVVENGIYEIVAGTNSDRVLDVSGGVPNARNGANVQIYDRNQTDAQRWRITYDRETDSYLIINPASNLSLDVSGGSLSSSANIQMYTQNGTLAQRWSITKNSDNSFTITSVNSNHVADIHGGSGGNSANVQQYVSNNTPAQKWQLTKLGN